MGLFNRLLNVAKGAATEATEKLEMNNPTAVIQNGINEMEKEIAALQQAQREITGERFKLVNINKRLVDTIKEREHQIKTAVSETKANPGNESAKNIAIKLINANDADKEAMQKNENLIEKLNEKERIIDEKKKEYVEQKNELEQRSMTAGATKSAANIMDKIQDRENGTAFDDVSKGLNVADKASDQAEASFEAAKYMEETSDAGQMKQFEKAAKNRAAEDKFAALLAED